MAKLTTAARKRLPVLTGVERHDAEEETLMNVDILIVLDRSGSMQSMLADHEGGIKSFIEDQRSLDGDVRLTLVQFDSVNPCEVVYDRAPLDRVTEVRLIPRGCTPLHDAVGQAVSHLRGQIADDAPVVVMVVTDGEENSSKEWTKDRVKALVTELEAKGWSFLFLGANIDAFATGGGLGMSHDTTATFTPQSVNAMYSATSSNMLRSRTAVASGGTVCMAYDDVQREAMLGGTTTTTGSTGVVAGAPVVTTTGGTK